MKKLFAGITRTRFITVASAFTCLITIATSAGAAQLKEARVTQVVSDVKLLPGQAAPRPAAVNDSVRAGTAVRTGTQSRSELTFTDLTITRLGANTIFSFNEGTREMTLTDGAILFQVPKGSGGATIKTSAVTAAITGTTGIGEFHPAAATASRNALPFSKWLCLEGTFRLYLANGESVELGPGKMVTTDGTSFSKVLDFDIGQVMKTALLVIGLDTPLPRQVLDLIALEEQKQLDLRLAGGFVDTTTVNFLDPTRIVDVISQAAAAIETAIPNEFGAPSVISSSVPYVITSGTVIITDPSITTNGVTDFGKVWRGTSIDGPLSAFIFGSTSAFDTAIGLDAGAEKVADSGAVFKFTSLELTGNPTVLTKNGQINLALVGVNGITSGGPGGTLTFAGISTLLLATQDGSINLGSEISFSGFQHLVFYARGAGSNLTLASPVSATIHLALFAEGSIQVSSVDATLTAERIKLFAGDSITLDGGVMSATATNSSGNVDIFAGNQISITNGLEIDRKFGGQPSGLNVTLSAGTDFTLGSSLVVNVDNSVTGNLNDGANISVMTGGNLTINGGGALSLTVDNSGGGHIGAGGNISLTTGGDITTSGGAEFIIDNSVGGSIGGDATISVTGASITANSLTAEIDNSGGMIGGAANVALNATGNVSAPGGVTLQILNSSGGHIGTGSAGDGVLYSVGGTTSTTNLLLYVDSSGGGVINNGGNVTLHTTGPVMMDGPLQMEVDSYNGGVINTGANVTGHFVGDVTDTLGSGHFLHFDVVNGDTSPSSGFTGGTIGTGGNINLTFDGNVEITGTPDTGFFSPLIFNVGGSIGTGGNISIAIGGNEVAGNVFIGIDNNQGHIGTGGNIAFDVAGDVTEAGGAALVLRNEGGTIGSSSIIDISAHNFSLNGSGLFAVFAVFDNSNAGIINGSANYNFTLSGDLATQGSAEFDIRNNNGGSIGANASIALTMNNMSVGTLAAPADLNVFINNTGGSINGNATIDMNVAGSASVTNNATVAIYGSDGAASAAINFNGGSYDAGGTFLAEIDGSGTITFNNASVHANVLQVGALGTNGVLNIGGGSLSADTTLKLYAPGSNGQLNFISNVTLGGAGAKILAANSVTIFNSVVVTIGGTNPADVYTNNANYSEGSGGNNSTTGTFAGAGANSPIPLSSAPPFTDPPLSPATVTSSTNVTASGTIVNSDLKTTSKKTTGAVMNVSDSGQLLSLLDGAVLGPGGKITIPDSKSTSNLRNSSRMNAPGRLKADRDTASRGRRLL